MSSRPPIRRFGSTPAERTPSTPSLFDDDTPERRAVTVSAYVAQLNGALRRTFPGTWVRGEVAEWRVWSSGHVYFTLKDPAATLNAMMWSDDAVRLPFRVETGMAVLAWGRPDVYPRSGKLTFVVSELQPYGAGALQLALEQLKKRLAAEGLFDHARKRPLPVLPRRIAVVTSRQGAAVRDILKVLSLRFPNASVTIYPAAVQGAFAAETIARAVRAFSRPASPAVDVLIVARGGGSREDLSAFNDERVVRAVASSRVPTIAAVGHEIDVTLTDLAADVRAATPSQAAELVVTRREELERILASRTKELRAALRSLLSETRANLAGAVAVLGGFGARVEHASLETMAARSALLGGVRALPGRFAERFASVSERLAAWPARAALPHLLLRIAREEKALTAALQSRLADARSALSGVAGSLSALDPLGVLARGYAVAYRDGSGSPLVSAEDVAVGDGIRVVLSRGEIEGRVTRSTPGPPRGARDEGVVK